VIETNQGTVQEMLNLNATTSNLKLEELKLMGNKITWTNKQTTTLLERLDCFFALVSWMTNYPVTTLSRDISYHSPCLISINTYIPKEKYSELKITCCFMMSFYKSCSMDGM
jgi:hypothetical protein